MLYQKQSEHINLSPNDSLMMRLKDRLFLSHKSVLLFHDIFVLLIAFSLTLYFIEANLIVHNPSLLFQMIAISLSFFVFVFWIFELYKYNNNFIWNIHFALLLKAFVWVFNCIVIFMLLLHYYYHSAENKYIPLLSGLFLSFLLIIKPSRFLFHITCALALSFIIIGASGILFHDNLLLIRQNSYVFPIIYLLSAGLILSGRYLLIHILFKGWMRKTFRKEMIIIGTEEEVKQVVNHIIKVDAPYYVKGFVSLNSASDVSSIAFKSFLGKVENLHLIVAENEIKDIVVTDENISKNMLVQLFDYCLEQKINIWCTPRLLPIINIKIRPDYMSGLPMFRMYNEKSNWLFKCLKYVFDLLIALPIFILQLPLFIIIALVVKLSSKGTVFYKPEMIGKNSKIFRMYKFRTMFTDCDTKVHENYVTKLIRGEIGQNGIAGQTCKIVDDPRITSVGRFLRKYSLDELPQLINVIKGEMSLVGPRPCTTYEFRNYQEWHKKRASVRPGITGIWQVTGRSEVTFEDMIMLDLYYIYNKSLLLDFQILYETVFVVLKQKGAF